MDNKEQKWQAQMRSLLAHNVPRFIKHIKDRGGVSKEEWQWLKCEEENPEYPMELILRADEYLLYPKDSKTFEKSLFVLVLALAIMSFIPGGVLFLGLRFCSTSSSYAQDDEVDLPASIDGQRFALMSKLIGVNGSSKT